MATSPIDLSAGMIPKQQPQQQAGDIDISAGLIPRAQMNLTANPRGQGTYAMWDLAGNKLSIPYENVPTARQMGYNFDTNAAANGKTPQDQFNQDFAADPNVHSAVRSLTPRERFLNPDLYPVGAKDESIGDNLLNIMQRGGVGVFQFADALMNPGRTVRSMASSVLPDPVINAINKAPDAKGRELTPGTPNPAEQAYSALATSRGPMEAIGKAAPLAGQALAGGALAEAVPGIVSDVKSASVPVESAARTALAGDVNAPIPGTDVTPAQRYASMKNMGVQPNAAEATNSTPLSMVEKVNQNSLTAAPTYAKARAQNLAALKDYTQDVLNKMSEKSPEEGGAAVQQGLRDAQTELQNQAASGFSDLDRQVGGRLLGGKTIQQTAKNIYDANADYYANHPALIPGNAWKIVKDLAGADTDPPFQPRPMRFPEVHQLRSDLLEMVRTNPDIVKNQAGGWLQQLANAADQTMTAGATGLSPEGVKVFRDANQAWADMKGTYDNPSHPFYQAVRTPTPSTLVKGIGQAPEMVKALQGALGPEGIGPIQRGVAENLLKTTKEGGYNFKTFQGQWNKLPQGYRESLFTPEQIEQLEGIGDAGTVLNEDANPSGSARLGQGIAEGAAALRSFPNLHEMAGNAAYHGAQYGLGRLMNSPTFVDWLMRGRGFAPIGGATSDSAASRFVPAAMASGTTADPHTGPNGEPDYYSDSALESRARHQAAWDAYNGKPQ